MTTKDLSVEKEKRGEDGGSSGGGFRTPDPAPPNPAPSAAFAPDLNILPDPSTNRLPSCALVNGSGCWEKDFCGAPAGCTDVCRRAQLLAGGQPIGSPEARPHDWRCLPPDGRLGVAWRCARAGCETVAYGNFDFDPRKGRPIVGCAGTVGDAPPAFECGACVYQGKHGFSVSDVTVHGVGPTGESCKNLNAEDERVRVRVARLATVPKDDDAFARCHLCREQLEPTQSLVIFRHVVLHPECAELIAIASRSRRDAESDGGR